MSDLQDLYQELILDHNKRPRNFGHLDAATHSADGYNPLCGDKIKVELIIEDGLVTDVRFDGSGCAISTASASLMTDAIKGKTIDEVRTLFGRMHDLLTGGGESDDLGKLQAFSGVKRYPMRVKCATLAWHTLIAAMKGNEDAVTTE